MSKLPQASIARLLEFSALYFRS